MEIEGKINELRDAMLEVRGDQLALEEARLDMLKVEIEFNKKKMDILKAEMLLLSNKRKEELEKRDADLAKMREELMSAAGHIQTN